jgi:hypothetical protein
LPLTLPNLDDRAWEDLVEEGRSLIPKWSPQWTNYNPSDPGITVLELFAYLTEMLMFRLNQVADYNVIAFLRLINGKPGAWKPDGDLQLATRDTLIAHLRLGRTVTCRDLEALALGFDSRDESSERIVRATCVPGRNLKQEWEGVKPGDSSADITLVVVPADGAEPNAPLLHRLAAALEPARLLTTRLHVTGPRYVTVCVRLTLKVHRHAHPERIRENAQKTLREFLDPLHGGADGGGWPFGRDVYVSEIYQLLSKLDGVEQVTPTIDRASGQRSAELNVAPSDQGRLMRNRLGEVEAIDLEPGELVRAQIEPADIMIAASRG